MDWQATVSRSLTAAPGADARPSFVGPSAPSLARDAQVVDSSRDADDLAATTGASLKELMARLGHRARGLL
jgi:hypothetical protein